MTSQSLYAACDPNVYGGFIRNSSPPYFHSSFSAACTARGGTYSLSGAYSEPTCDSPIGIYMAYHTTYGHWGSFTDASARDSFCSNTSTPECPTGATYSQATSACACPAGQTVVNGACQNACTTGQSAAIWESFSTNSSGEMDISLHSKTSGRTACYDGCTYNVSDANQIAGALGASADGNTLFHQFNGTKTGASCSTGNVTASNVPTQTTTNDTSNCVTNTAGKKVCQASTELETCGSVQAGTGSPVVLCPKSTDTPNCISIPGFADPVCSGAPKNCGWINGQYICAESDTAPAAAGQKTCMINGVAKDCFTGAESVKTTSTQSSVTNPDGSTTTTKTTSSNVLGTESTSSITTTQPDGSTSTVQSGGNDGKDSNNLGDIAKNTKDTADDTESIKTALDSTGVSSTLDAADTDPLQNYYDNFTAGTQGSIDSVNGTDFLDYINPAQLFPTTTCQGIVLTWHGTTYNLNPCDKLAFMRLMLGYLLTMYTFYRIVGVLTDRQT